jgi:hypothetical protein
MRVQAQCMANLRLIQVNTNVILTCSYAEYALQFRWVRLLIFPWSHIRPLPNLRHWKHRNALLL